MKSKRTLIFFLSLFLAGVVSAQKIQQKKDSFEKARQLVSRVDGTLSYIEFNKSRTNTFADWSVFLVRTLELDHSVTFQLKGQEKDKLGYTHQKFSQEINGIPVEHSMVSLHLLEDQVKSISGFYKKVSSELQYAPNLSVSEILEMTQNHFDDYQILSELSDVELVYFPLRDDLKLAYRIKIESLNSIGLKHAYLSAENGALIASTDLICMDDSEGEAYTLYSGVRSIQTTLLNNGHYNLYDQVRNVKTYDLNGEDDDPSNALLIEDEDNIWEEDEYDQHGALDAHWGASVSYDYYLSEHDYDSYDNQAAEILSYVNFETDQSIAFWNSEAMVFGSGAEGDSPYTSLDIVAHELTHAFTQHMVGFVNLNESGALSESFSDIFGVVIDYHVRGNEVANFLIGDECAITPVRNMANPNEFEGADTYQGDFWISDPLFNNGGIHFNCGVQNFWFYLLCEGGSGINDNGDEYDVEPIGMDAAADLCFRSLQAYLTSFSDFEDARTFSIVAARELFGDCSDEVIAVTNAWHAVGVGDPFSFEVIADFSSSVNEACALPVNVQFSNSSQNATTYIWDFGDGQTSDEAFPSHNYEEEGTYDVQLIANGEGNCAGSDTLTIPDLVNISNSENGPIPPACIPTSLANPLSFGTDRVQFESIDIFSGDDSEAYSDFTCDATAFLNAGSSYSLIVDLFVPSKLVVWIDFNNDGEFGFFEKVYEELNDDPFIHQGEIVIPETSFYDTPLRMRVKNMSQGWDVDPCFNQTPGQMEDYTVIIGEPVPQPPQSGFSVNNNISFPSEEVQFTNLSLHFPLTYQWSFNGGEPSISSDINPVVNYDTEGSYDVQLITTNFFGSDTLLMEDYMHVVDSYTMCVGEGSSSRAGRMYDSGGPDGSYSENEDCGFLIDLPCATKIEIEFEHYGLNCDVLRVYEGFDDTGILLDSYGCNDNPDALTVYGGQAYIRFTSNWIGNGSGWALTWVGEQEDDLPVASFLLANDDQNLSEALVEFQDYSDDSVISWNWDFGDGSISNEQNPTHIYTGPGFYDVSLEVQNCSGSDVFTQTIEILPSSELELSLPDTFHVLLNCGEADTLSLSFNNPNSDPGLIWGRTGWADEVIPVIKAPMLYSSGSPSPLELFIEALDSLGFALPVEQIDLSINQALAEEVGEADIAIFDLGYNAQLTDLVIEYISAGGVAMVVDNGIVSLSDELGLENSFFPNQSEIFLTPEGEGFLPYIPYQSVAYSLMGVDPPYTDIMGVVDPEMTSLVVVGSAGAASSVVWSRKISQGHLISTGSYYESLTPYNSQLALDLMNFAWHELLGANWLSFSDEGSILLPAITNYDLQIFCESSDMPAGDYFETLEFNYSGDNGSPEQVVIHLTLSESAHLQIPVESFVATPVIAGYETTDSLLVRNSGCSTLEGTIEIGSESFSSPLDFIELGPQEEIYIPIDFSPQNEGYHEGEIIFTGNFESTSLTLEGTALSVPSFSTNFGDTIQITLECEGTLDTTLFIQNQSLGDLVLTDQLDQGEEDLQVLFIRSGFSQNLVTLIESNLGWPFTLDNYFLNFDLLDQDPLGDSLSSIINDYDIVICHSESWVINTGIADHVESAFTTYLGSGGFLILPAYNPLNEYDFFPINEDFQVSGNSSLISTYQVIDLDHPIVHDLDLTLSSKTQIFSYPLSSNDNLSAICQRNNSGVVIQYSPGSGKVIYLGFRYIAGEEIRDEVPLLMNAIKYGALQRLPEWLELDYFGGQTLLSGDSLAIPISLDFVGRDAGIYNHSIQFNTNIPGEEVQSVVFHVVISGESQLEISSNSVDFGQVMLGNSYIQTLTIENEGCDALNLSVSSPSYPFQIQDLEIAIPAYSSYELEVGFQPNALGIYDDEITITSDGTLETISLLGEANQNALADFSITPVDECQGAYQFTCTNCLGTESVSWVFGDGFTSEDIAPLHTFEASGEYTITLTVDNGTGSQTLSQALSTPLRGIETIVIPELLVQGEPVEFQALSDVMASYTWNFGDGVEISNGDEVVSHTYTNGGSYEVSVSLETDTDVCFDSQVSEIQVGFLSTQNRESTFLVWPNPNRGSFSIEAQMAFEVVRIINHLGQEVKYEFMKIGESSIEVKLENQSSGVYTIEISGFGHKSRVRVIVQ